ncbi:hypothetical protein [Streptomyces sp. b94]|uniref:hypothetical protein n=1 Tax=Streptomyces sp. b94 TaxID=1827634 RepID=UPI0027DB59D6|nr:hypothetical protein [Streptomyces sp. b94]
MLTSTLVSSHTDGSGSGVCDSSGAEVLGDGEAGAEVLGAGDSGAEVLGELLGESLAVSLGGGAVSLVDWLGAGSVEGVLSGAVSAAELAGGWDVGVSPVA